MVSSLPLFYSHLYPGGPSGPSHADQPASKKAKLEGGKKGAKGGKGGKKSDSFDLGGVLASSSKQKKYIELLKHKVRNEDS